MKVGVYFSAKIYGVLQSRMTLYAWLAIVLLERWHFGSAVLRQRSVPQAAHRTA
jgi:hypothetical protein